MTRFLLALLLFGGAIFDTAQVDHDPRIVRITALVVAELGRLDQRIGHASGELLQIAQAVVDVDGFDLIWIAVADGRAGNQGKGKGGQRQTGDGELHGFRVTVDSASGTCRRVKLR